MPAFRNIFVSIAISIAAVSTASARGAHDVPEPDSTTGFYWQRVINPEIRPLHRGSFLYLIPLCHLSADRKRDGRLLVCGRVSTCCSMRLVWRLPLCLSRLWQFKAGPVGTTYGRALR